MPSQVCFTGFGTFEKMQLSQRAANSGLDVVKSVTRSLAYLVIGPNAGPAKLKTAQEQHVIIMDEEQFNRFMDTEVLPEPSAELTTSLPTPSQCVSADSAGIFGCPIADTPVAVLDFETTGLSPGIDRVVEVSVVRRDPDGHSETVLDTLVNPHRRMGATEIHGITDADVANAPGFKAIASDLAAAISGCVLAAYNVYFDMRFFAYEMSRAGFPATPPYLCLMYLRPLLGLGAKCSLGEACRLHGVPYSESHMAADDAEAAANLMDRYMDVMHSENIQCFGDLSQRGSYKFLESFHQGFLRYDRAEGTPSPKLFCSRKSCSPHAVAPTPSQTLAASVPHNGIAAYWDALKASVVDLVIDEKEAANMRRIVAEYGLQREQVRMLHARVFAGVINQFIADQCLDDQESEKLKRLHQCLSKLGWAPGE
jgi:DNA polymerase III subunit epsilon